MLRAIKVARDNARLPTLALFATTVRNDNMVGFEKTRIHAISAVLFLLGLYALAGVAYAAYARSVDAAVGCAIVAVLAFVASSAYQRHVKKKRIGAQ